MTQRECRALDFSFLSFIFRVGPPITSTVFSILFLCARLFKWDGRKVQGSCSQWESSAPPTLATLPNKMEGRPQIFPLSHLTFVNSNNYVKLTNELKPKIIHQAERISESINCKTSIFKCRVHQHRTVNYADASPFKNKCCSYWSVVLCLFCISKLHIYVCKGGEKENSGGKDPIWRPRSNPSVLKKRNKCHLVFSLFFSFSLSLSSFSEPGDESFNQITLLENGNGGFSPPFFFRLYSVTSLEKLLGKESL